MSDNKNPAARSDPDEMFSDVRMIWNAKSLQRVVKELEPKESESPQSDQILFNGKFLAGPILLSQAIEIALKAWCCREQKKAPEKTHNLLKLFNKLNPETQEMMEASMRKWSQHSGAEAITPKWDPDTKEPLYIQEMFVRVKRPLRRVLDLHQDANMHWRYIYESKGFEQFETSELDRALTVILDAYVERWGDSA